MGTSCVATGTLRPLYSSTPRYLRDGGLLVIDRNITCYHGLRNKHSKHQAALNRNVPRHAAVRQQIRLDILLYHMRWYIMLWHL